MVTHGSIEVLTKEYNCLVKITDDIRQIVEKSKIRNGVVYVITAHTTTGIAVNEGLECLEYDIGHLMERLVPEDGEYAHGRLLDTYGGRQSDRTFKSPSDRKSLCIPGYRWKAEKWKRTGHISV